MSVVFVPKEAKPYCNHMGIINWRAVVELIRQERGMESRLESSYQLRLILDGTMKDEHGALPIMRSLKLDQVISARMFDKTHPHFIKSKALAEEFAADFGIDISQIPGTGPDGMVLKHDVVTFIRLRRVGKIAAIQSQEPAEEASKSPNLQRLLRQRRILARHLLEKNRMLADRGRSLDTALKECLGLQNKLYEANGRANESRDRLAATSEKLGDALTEKLAAEARADRMEQMRDALRADLDKACTDRTNAIARAIAAEERAAQADRMLSQILSELHAPRTLRRTGTWLDHVIGFLFRLSPKEAHA